jgi:hypothetical protein
MERKDAAIDPRWAMRLTPSIETTYGWGCRRGDARPPVVITDRFDRLIGLTPEDYSMSIRRLKFFRTVLFDIDQGEVEDLSTTH